MTWPPVRFDGRERDGASRHRRLVTIDRPRYWTQAEWIDHWQRLQRAELVSESVPRLR